MKTRPHSAESLASPWRIAAEAVTRADRAHPADAVLREVLKRQTGLAPETGALAARAMFAYFRWLGWLKRETPILSQLREAEALAHRFARNPGAFSPAELAAKAIPQWIAGAMLVPPAWPATLQAEPTLWLRARPGALERLRTRLDASRDRAPDALPDALAHAGELDLFRTEEFHAGDFEVQDIASQAVGWMCAPRPGETWWDACAGEGGKTLHLSALMQNRGLIWASDRAAWRLQRLKRRAARAGVFNYRLAPWDGSARLPTRTKFDGVLVDAPCSGLGTWQRNPHARWTTTRADVEELAQVQRQLLRHAASSLKPGGRLIYAVCTMTDAETAGVVAAFEKEFPNFAPCPLPNPFAPDAPPATPHWLWPQATHGNGMFVAAWRRNEARPGIS